MSLINTVALDTAQDEMKALYAEVEQAMGFVPNAFQVFSASPQVARHIWDHISFYLQHPSLSPQLLGMIRLLSSEGDKPCHYCINLNEAVLINHMGVDSADIAAIREDITKAPLNAKELPLLLSVMDAVNNPKCLTAERIQSLRDVGNSDTEILEAVNHAARQQAFNLVVSSFHVENEM